MGRVSGKRGMEERRHPFARAKQIAGRVGWMVMLPALFHGSVWAYGLIRIYFLQMQYEPEGLGALVEVSGLAAGNSLRITIILALNTITQKIETISYLVNATKIKRTSCLPCPPYFAVEYNQDPLTLGDYLHPNSVEFLPESHGTIKSEWPSLTGSVGFESIEVA